MSVRASIPGVGFVAPNNAISALQEASELLKRYDARDRSRRPYYQDEETLPKRAIRTATQ
jgi:hypothetical protein